MLPENGEWVGPPVLILQLRAGKQEIIDGRRRLDEHSARGLKTHVPTLIINSHFKAIKHLIHNNHHERAAIHAATYAPELVQRSSSSLAILLDMSHAKVLPYIRALKSPAERHKLPRRAMTVVMRARALYKRSVEGERIEIEDIEKVLGEFIE